MNVSNHWMASLYTNVPASAGGWESRSAKEINAHPRGSGHRDPTHPLNNTQTSLSCLAVSSGHKVWSERTKLTSWSVLITRLSAFFFHFTSDQIFSQFLMGFPLMRREKDSFVIYDCIKLSQGKYTRPVREDRLDWSPDPAAQLPTAQCSCGDSQLRLFSWVDLFCVVWKTKLKKKKRKTIVCLTFCTDVGSRTLRSSYYTKCGASPCGRSLSARVNTTLPSPTSLIDKEPAGGHITWCSYLPQRSAFLSLTTLCVGLLLLTPTSGQTYLKMSLAWFIPKRNPLTVWEMQQDIWNWSATEGIHEVEYSICESQVWSQLAVIAST